jgi:glucose-1-phosphate adenylyltransferase
LDRALWEDHDRPNSEHDFGKDILPSLVAQGKRVYAFPFDGYWVDVGTVEAYWKSHMDLLASPPPLDLNDRSWIIHTRTEERPPVWIASGAVVEDSMITDGCEISAGARVERSVLGPGVRVGPGAVVRESVLFTEASVAANASIEQTILDKRVKVGEKACLGALQTDITPRIAMIGKNSLVPPGMVIEPGAVIGTDVIDSDYPAMTVRGGDYIQTKRLPYEV